MTSVNGHPILVTGVKYSSGTEWYIPDEELKQAANIDSKRNTLAADEGGSGFHYVQSH